MKLSVPKLACDMHHIYDDKVPAAKGTFMPGHYPVAAYKTLQKKPGLECVIVVQPNGYADDNRVTLHAKGIRKSAKASPW